MARVPLAGVELIKQFEGLHLSAYRDPLSGGKPYTIGWGSTRRQDGRPFDLGERISREEAENLLIYQLDTEFLSSLERIPVWGELNDNQRGALLSFAYNLGAAFYGSAGFETISRVLRNREWDKIESALLLYRNPGTHVEEGLRRRRLAEAALFLTPADQTPVKSSQPIPTLSAQAGDRLLYLATPYLFGEDVKALQRELARTGAGVLIDGVFGPATDLAVKRFQTVNSLQPDGIVGPQTLALLRTRPLYLREPYLQGDDVLALQRLLQAAGYVTTADGIFGPGTRRTVEQFQRAYGLVPDGIIGPKTLKILKAKSLSLAEPYLRGEAVVTLQKALQQRGFNLVADGVYGPSTAMAVEAFQRRSGLIADGIAGRQTWAKLLD
ncbi:MAG: glycoside hydrolase family protein [Leptolyngbyaceae cyanobacterium SM1_1_3]|nr:glycoside hydrolase family protein [Leptolyngbyaceae cyanobacterium SM1_1_3]NJN01068.1 glycoside hydrolase family protein [Leptolyngbyaceae cyanobacterium RM1_1_2]NJO11866.1 glycoside hydrolase family protein [Leptolyngbyaceae cyanobacterium SL_1_1]